MTDAEINDKTDYINKWDTVLEGIPVTVLYLKTSPQIAVITL